MVEADLRCHLEAGYHQLQLLQPLMRRGQVQASLRDLFEQRRSRPGHQRPGANIVGIDRRQHARGILRVLVPAFPPAQIRHPVLRHLEPRGDGLAPAFDLLGAGHPLAHERQQFVIPRLQTDVHAVQTGRAHHAQILRLSFEQRFRAGVAGHPGKRGQGPAQVLQHRHVLARPHAHAVGVLQERRSAACSEPVEHRDEARIAGKIAALGEQGGAQLAADFAAHAQLR